MFNDLFLRACRLEETERRPVWLMRQAGRYMESYQRVRREHSFMEMCRTPELAAEVTLQPVREFGFDAAILFSDILVPVEAMGVEVEFVEGTGPVLGATIDEEADVEGLRVPDPYEDLSFVLDAIKILRKKLEVPLIGFSGAPFTLASYILEGGGSRSYERAKSVMYNEPGIWKGLMSKITDTVIAYLNAQIEAGAQAVQVFDSWAGALSPEDYRAYALPYSKRVFDSLRGDVPAIHFGTGTSGYIELIREAGGDVIGVDWRIDIGEAWQRIGYDRGIQGNLDPLALHARPEVLRRKILSILEGTGDRPGHIFNLGHGILPTTSAEKVRLLVDAVKRFSPL
ncbi:MAG: uroporphyrinogen decarboxylase [Methanobacteriota archaeon]|nr:MAG: uroporphyrinogen decarboxylase [Euryarchaeota archaeon]